MTKSQCICYSLCGHGLQIRAIVSNSNQSKFTMSRHFSSFLSFRRRRNLRYISNLLQLLRLFANARVFLPLNDKFDLLLFLTKICSLFMCTGIRRDKSRLYHFTSPPLKLSVYNPLQYQQST